MSERGIVNGEVCHHCGKPIREGERGVNWPWIHANGYYQCARVDGSTKAEPEHLHWATIVAFRWTGPDGQVAVIDPSEVEVVRDDPRVPSEES